MKIHSSRNFPGVILMSLLMVGSVAAATIIHVPADQPTIQAAINPASNGDTVLVSPGTYTENIDFNGKAITVKSSNGRSVTTIANSTAGFTVTFGSSEGPGSVLQGFTISGGAYASGIIMRGTSPTILNNLITGNHDCDGAGISIYGGSAIIKGNDISNNYHDKCSGGQGGGGILVGDGSPQIIGNVIYGNDGGNGFAGGGISVWGTGAPIIMNNIIEHNTISLDGGGLGIATYGNPIIAQNIIAGNSANDGAAVYSFPGGGQPVLVNNTFVNNKSSTGNSAVYTNSPGGPTLLYNNIIVALKGQIALFCAHFNSTGLPMVISNDVFAPQGTTYGGICSDETGINGNISADPQFVGTSNFRLKGGSPAIDAGNNSAADLPATDFAGNPRIINGNDGPTAIVDMGAYEFIPVSLTPKILNFGLQVVGSTTTKTVTLTNAQNKSLSISSKTVPTGYKVGGCGTSVAAFSSCSLTVTFHPLTTGSFKGDMTIKDNAGNSPQAVSLLGSAH